MSHTNHQKHESVLEFANGTLNLKTYDFKQRKKQEKNNETLMQLAVKYEDKNDIKIEFLKENLINKIFKIENERKIHLQYDAEMLHGSSSKQMMFNIAGKGKSLWTNLLIKIMGTYAVAVPSSLISDKTENEKTNWELLKEKRFLLFEGVDVQKIDVDFVKKCCDCFSQTKCQINCQEVPGSLTKDEKLMETIILFRFGEQIKITINEDILSDKFVEKYGCQLIHILLEYHEKK